MDICSRALIAGVDDLRDRRRTRGLRQEDLAALAGVDQSTVSRGERHVTRFSPEVQRRLREALDLEPPSDAELLADIERPLADLADEARRLHELIQVIARELGTDIPDRAFVLQLWAAGQRRLEAIKRAVDARVASLPGRSQ